METCIGGTSVGKAEKAGRKADCVQSIENRQSYETEEEKLQSFFIGDDYLVWNR